MSKDCAVERSDGTTQAIDYSCSIQHSQLTCAFSSLSVYHADTHSQSRRHVPTAPHSSSLGWSHHIAISGRRVSERRIWIGIQSERRIVAA